MNFIAWAHRHSRSILFLLTVLAIAGAASSFTLPVSLFPQVSFPRIRVSRDAGDRPAERMTVEVTTPVEEAVRSHSPQVRSTTSRAARKFRSVLIGART